MSSKPPAIWPILSDVMGYLAREQRVQTDLFISGRFTQLAVRWLLLAKEVAIAALSLWCLSVVAPWLLYVAFGLVVVVACMLFQETRAQQRKAILWAKKHKTIAYPEDLLAACRDHGIDVPKAYAGKGDGLKNAIAAWVFGGYSWIVVHKMLLKNHAAIVSGVLAHEIGHLQNRDQMHVSLRRIVAVFHKIAYLIAVPYVAYLLATVLNPFGSSAFAQIAPSLSWCAVIFFLRVLDTPQWLERLRRHQDEYAADAFAARILGTDAIIHTLDVLGNHYSSPRRRRDADSTTHPSIDIRIEVLRRRAASAKA